MRYFIRLKEDHRSFCSIEGVSSGYLIINKVFDFTATNNSISSKTLKKSSVDGFVSNILLRLQKFREVDETEFHCEFRRSMEILDSRKRGELGEALSSLFPNAKVVHFSKLKNQMKMIADRTIAHIEHQTEFTSYLQCDGNILLLESDTVCDGDIDLGFDSPLSKDGISCLFILGDLNTTGKIFNTNLDSGLTLFVSGNLTAEALYNGGSTIVVYGDVLAKDIALFNYNHGLVRVAGNLTSNCYFCIDQNAWVAGEIKTSEVYIDPEDFDRPNEYDKLVPELVRSDDDISLVEGSEVWNWYCEGRPICK